jgi:hypothetical protein
MPSPKSIAADAVAAADSVAPANPSVPSTAARASAAGSGPTPTSHRLRKTRKSSGRISASEPIVFRMLSRLTIASVSTAIR